MSITGEIERIKTNIANAYTELEAKNVILPEVQNSENLAETIKKVEGDNSMFIAVMNGTAKEVVLPEDVTLIRNDMFKVTDGRSSSQYYPISDYRSYLTSFIAPGVKKVEKNGFLNQYKLTYVSMPNCEEIGESVFNMYFRTYGYDHNYKNVRCTFYLPSLKSVGTSAFKCQYALDINFESQLETIGNSAFYDMLNTSTYKWWDLKNAKTIGEKAFASAYGYFWVPSTVETIDKSAFTNGHVYTDVASADEVPEGWVSTWSSSADVTYGTTYQEFLEKMANA